MLFTTPQHDSTQLPLYVGGALTTSLTASLAFVLLSAGIGEQPSAWRRDITSGYGLLCLASAGFFFIIISHGDKTHLHFFV